MAEHLYLQPEIDGWSWLLLEQTSGIVRLRGNGSLEELADALSGMAEPASKRLLIPGESVLVTRIKVPSRNRRQIQQAVPFLAEEELATDVEEMHFAIGAREANGKVLVGALADSQLQQWTAELGEAGLAPDHARADCLCLPAIQASGHTVFVSERRVLLAWQDGSAMAVEPETASSLLAMAEQDAGQPFQVLVEPGSDPEDVFVRQLLTELGYSEDPVVADYSLFESCCRNFERSQLEFLQGVHQVKRKVRRVNSPWQNVALLAGAAVALHLMLLASEGVFLDRQAQQFSAEAFALYKSVFPQDKNVRDMRRRWRAHISGGTDSETVFMEIFAVAASKLSASQLILENVNFNESRGDLVLQVQAPRSEALVSFSQTLSAAGLAAEIGTISQEEDQVRGSVKIAVGSGS